MSITLKSSPVIALGHSHVQFELVNTFDSSSFVDMSCHAIGVYDGNVRSWDPLKLQMKLTIISGTLVEPSTFCTLGGSLGVLGIWC